jgi:hypothetical protein
LPSDCIYDNVSRHENGSRRRRLSTLKITPCLAYTSALQRTVKERAATDRPFGLPK